MALTQQSVEPGWACQNEVNLLTPAEVMVTSGAEHPEQPLRRGSVPVEELARRRGVRPVTSVDDMAQDGVLASDEELEEFLAHVYAARDEDLA